MVRRCLDLERPIPEDLPWARARGCSVLIDGEICQPAGLDAAGLLDRCRRTGLSFITSLNGKSWAGSTWGFWRTSFRWRLS